MTRKLMYISRSVMLMNDIETLHQLMRIRMCISDL